MVGELIVPEATVIKDDRVGNRYPLHVDAGVEYAQPAAAIDMLFGHAQAVRVIIHRHHIAAGIADIPGRNRSPGWRANGLGYAVSCCVIAVSDGGVAGFCDAGDFAIHIPGNIGDAFLHIADEVADGVVGVIIRRLRFQVSRVPIAVAHRIVDIIQLVVQQVAIGIQIVVIGKAVHGQAHGRAAIAYSIKYER